MDPTHPSPPQDRPNKRARSGSAPQSPNPAVRDTTFYHESGDCVIRVEDTLFKIHRYILVRDSPVFASLFTLPQGGATEEGLSDELPICLSDEAIQFCCLLKYMYAPVIDTQVKNLRVAQVGDIVSIAHLSHKYEMMGWQQWVSLAILELCARNAVDDSDQLSSAEFSVLYDICRRTTDLAVRDKITETWFEDVSSGILDPGNALNAAATDNNHPFLAQLYRLYLSQHTPLRTDMSTPVNFPVEGIASIHVQRMFAGHWSLSIYWNQLRKDMIPLPNAVGCSFIDHQTYCLPMYKAKWKEAASEAQDCYPLTEIPERLRHMRQRLLKAKSLTVCPSETGRWRCIEAVRGSNNKFSTLIQECESCVAKHFFVSEPAEPVST